MVSDRLKQIVERVRGKLTSKPTPKEQLEKNLKIFNGQLSRLRKYGSGQIAAIMAQRAATFAAYRHTGLFTSVELENFISDISREKVHSATKQSPVGQGATLHILSRALEAGGHTRVVERWISASPRSEVHSLLITRGGKPTAKLKAAISDHKGDVVIQQRFSSLLKRARQIQTVSRNYSRVVLHVHMDDILPLLAFSEDNESPEIVHFNHADHRFWVGSTLPNRVIEMRTWGKRLSESHRAIHNSEVVGIPLPELGEKRNIDKNQAREVLGISKNDQVLLTVGHSRKYFAENQLHLAEAVRNLLLGFPNRRLIVVGPGPKLDSNWKKLASDFPDQVKILPYIPKEKLDLFMRASDLGLDSFPMSGGTAVLDMLSNELPFISLKCATGHFDVIHESPFYCQTLEEWINKANLTLKQNSITVQVAMNHILREAENRYGSNVWARLLTGGQKNLPTGLESEAVNIEELNEYLVSSTPKLAKLFF